MTNTDTTPPDVEQIPSLPAEDTRYRLVRHINNYTEVSEYIENVGQLIRDYRELQRAPGTVFIESENGTKYNLQERR